MKNHSKYAFTLIELLVVIAIIAILAAILFPVFAQAKAAAKKTSCLSNNKQFSLAEIMYANDYDDTFAYDAGGDPGMTYYGQKYVNGAMDPTASTNWQRGIYPYVKSFAVALCPTAVDDDGTDGWGCFNNDGTPTTFCSSMVMNAAYQGKPTTVVSQPAGTIVLQESVQKQKVSQSGPKFDRNATTLNMSNIDSPVFDVNHNGGNFGYADGHAKFGKKSSIPLSAFGAVGACTAGNFAYGFPATFPFSPIDATQAHMLDIDPRDHTKYPSYGGWQYDLWNIKCTLGN
jgi:prepilin-type N-terminal cleavage/methylation domain-containing protein/prepilin-type processing-associated H-X9-DG protein